MQKSFFITHLLPPTKGHGSDRAVLAGILGMQTDDPGVRDAIHSAEEVGLVFSFKMIPNALHLHPNTIELKLEGDGRTLSLLGESLGGGVVNISSVNGYRSGFDGTLMLLMITAKDIPGVIAFVSEVLAHDNCNIASMIVSRKQKAGTACHFIEMDSPLRPQTFSYLLSLDMIEDIKKLEIRA